MRRFQLHNPSKSPFDPPEAGRQGRLINRFHQLSVASMSDKFLDEFFQGNIQFIDIDTLSHFVASVPAANLGSLRKRLTTDETLTSASLRLG